MLTAEDSKARLCCRISSSDSKSTGMLSTSDKRRTKVVVPYFNSGAAPEMLSAL